MEDFIKQNAKEYKRLLANYLDSQDERSLYGVDLVSKAFLKNSMMPEELINLHIKAFEELRPDLYEEIEHSFNFLLEAMISYGVAFQEVLVLREEKLALKSEISIAAKMQQTLLQTNKPEIEGLDIGVISVPANQMNGDYYQFVENNNGTLGIAMADVIGKGIPAALCMSMIKYAMDSLPDQIISPKEILRNLNRVVERNIESNMFITMAYALYDANLSELTYSFAGHEPGFYYNSVEDHFEEITTRGLVLGVSKEAKYEERRLKINENDMVIFLTDGVTECRDGDRFIEIREVLDVIRKYINLPAQEIVNRVYKHFEKLQEFQLEDDFSLLILRKKVWR